MISLERYKKLDTVPSSRSTTASQILCLRCSHQKMAERGCHSVANFYRRPEHLCITFCRAQKENCTDNCFYFLDTLYSRQCFGEIFQTFWKTVSSFSSEFLIDVNSVQRRALTSTFICCTGSCKCKRWVQVSVPTSIYNMEYIFDRICCNERFLSIQPLLLGFWKLTKEFVQYSHFSPAQIACFERLIAQQITIWRYGVLATLNHMLCQGRLGISVQSSNDYLKSLHYYKKQN